MNSKKDPMGRAIADYWKTGTADRLRVFSPMFEEDEIPLQTLFRKYEDMPEIERMALDLAKGKTLDVGAGSGCHSLVLQEKGIDVTAEGTIRHYPHADEWHWHRRNLGASAQILPSVRQYIDFWRSGTV